MSKKLKGVILDSTPPYGVGVYEDAKARLKHRTLMQDFEELQKEADARKSQLEAANQRRLMHAAEVRFLRRRYKYLMKTKNMSPPQEQHPVQGPKSLKQRKKTNKEQLFKEASQHRSALVPESNPKKHKQAALHDSSQVTNKVRKKILQHNPTPISVPFISDLNHKGRIHISKETTPNLDIDHKERMLGVNNAALRNSIAFFDLNQDNNSLRGKEASLPSRAPIFDLNEISTGEEDLESNVEGFEMEDANKSLIRGINDEQQNDLKLSICRNAGEGSSRVGKRKISWQDPVALRV